MIRVGVRSWSEPIILEGGRTVNRVLRPPADRVRHSPPMAANRDSPVTKHQHVTPGAATSTWQRRYARTARCLVAAIVAANTFAWNVYTVITDDVYSLSTSVLQLRRPRAKGRPLTAGTCKQTIRAHNLLRTSINNFVINKQSPGLLHCNHLVIYAVKECWSWLVVIEMLVVVGYGWMLLGDMFLVCWDWDMVGSVFWVGLNLEDV
ncbi:hypothetical protein K1T71_013427 [Dendrolimus kikuchii]|uniref:Uncharacterized protein n=1 Tax=Dendrolimus kikuchii TaxID=765133 RepID=A0ACC1CI13_9NEOP|nr:hypothetical protein K1T71_013427 [Dendrolimus kikuchii]